MEIRGLIPATLTPFTSDNRVDLPALVAHLQQVASTSGLFGIAVKGHAVDVLALGSEERETIVRAAREALVQLGEFPSARVRPPGVNVDQTKRGEIRMALLQVGLLEERKGGSTRRAVAV